MSRFKAIIFHIRISMGHERAAEALSAAFARRLGADAEVHLVEAMEFSSGWLAPAVCRTYLSMVKYAPAVWDYLYDDPKAPRTGDPFLRQAARFSRKKFMDLMSDTRPDAVVCTQAIPAWILSHLKSRGYRTSPGMSAPTYASVTDYSIHRYWPSQGIDGYFVPSSRESARLAEMGVPAEKIRSTGIPIHPEMADPVPAAELESARARLGMVSGRPTVLLMGGSRGFGLTANVMRELERLPIPLNILAPAGTNPRVFQAMRQWSAESNHRVISMEYTSDIRTLYALSDLAITKPGGLTLAECLAVGLPMVIQHALPGQERHNLDYIRREGLGEIGLDAVDVAGRVQALLMDPARRANLRARMKSHAQPDAAFSIVDHLLGNHPSRSDRPFPPAGESPAPVLISRGH